MKSLGYYKEAIWRNLIYRSAPLLTRISPRLNTKVLYRYNFKKKLDLDHPVTLNDKVLWLKFNTYWNNETVKQCADKYRVRDYLQEKGFSELLVDLIGVYDDPEKIDWDILPDSFALKLNVGCGKNIIVNHKTELDIPKTVETMKAWMKEKYYLGHSEMQYKDVKPYILIERNLSADTGMLPDDYKFYCMNGKSMYVMVCEDREIGKKAKYFYFDKAWNMMPYSQDALDDPDRVIPKPEGIDLAFEYAEKLSKEFPFVRVDLYIVDGKVYFGELTFTPSAGLDTGRLPATDRILGDQLVLPTK